MYTTMVFSYSAIISQVDLRHSTDAARPRYRDNGRSKNLEGGGVEDIGMAEPGPVCQKGGTSYRPFLVSP